jgi:KaiC/GvpD/RAD55 family RecA-like ATPase
VKNTRDVLQKVVAEELQLSKALEEQRRAAIKPPHFSKGLTPELLDNFFAGERDTIGLKTGIDAIDKGCHGLSKVTVLAGGTNVGKSGFTLFITRKVIEQGNAVLIFTLENERLDIYKRLLATLSYDDLRLSPSDIHLQANKPEIKAKLQPYINNLERAELRIIEYNDFTTQQVEFKSKLLGDKENNKDIDKQVDQDSFVEPVREYQKYLKEAYPGENKELLVIIDYLAVTPHLKGFSNQLEKENYLTQLVLESQKITQTPFLVIAQTTKAKNEDEINDIKGSNDLVYKNPVVLKLVEYGKNEEEKKKYPDLKILNIIKRKDHVLDRGTGKQSVQWGFTLNRASQDYTETEVPQEEEKNNGMASKFNKF